MSRKIGLTILVFGATILIWASLAQPKKQKEVELGPFEVAVHKKHSINWLPYLGTALVAGGLVLVATSERNKAR